MSLYLRLVIGPLILIDAEFFKATLVEDDAPPQLTGGQGMVIEPDPEPTFGFHAG